MIPLEQSIVRGGIYLVQLGEGVGSEQSGSRPFLVLQNDKGNERSYTHTGVPLITELKSLYLPTHIIASDSSCLKYTSVVLIEQMRSLSRKRFVSYLGKLDANTLNEVEVAVSIQLGLKDIRNVDKITFMKRLTRINPCLNVYLCGKCRRELYKAKGLAVHGIHESGEALDFCVLCHTAKGRKYKIVNRERFKRK
jgi:mRNA interferase MazF